MIKKALVIGIDDYNIGPLSGCVHDAKSVAKVLSRNEDGSRNFDVKILTSDIRRIDCVDLNDAIDDLFLTDVNVDIALFYFAGHGMISSIGEGFLVAQDGRRGAIGKALSEIISVANKAHPRINSTVIILDSCHAGALGEMSVLQPGVSVLGNGVTILTACHRSQGAAEFDGHGLFTGMLVESLSGSAADICGRITPASIYSNIDQLLNGWEQRPIYKANVQTFINLRQVAPKVPMKILRSLHEHFPDENYLFPLDPSFEPMRDNVPPEILDIPVNPSNAEVFAGLQACNRQGLVVPVGTEHMYYAAIESKRCKLTALGKHYRTMAEKGLI